MTNWTSIGSVACLSPYHWHRIYHGFYGETAAATVRRLRLHRTVNALVHGSVPIDSIAERAGYSSVQAFSRVFQASYRMAPAQFRNEGGAAMWGASARSDSSDSIQSGGAAMHQVDIRAQGPFTVAAMEHRGSNSARGW
ncbi:helix-turn-helix transcriptional regulator [Caballeronia ptereochthonis]|uniref:helix-turn-helix transcriptional regulator n=1 Tax=Caballeronia ptereochthonis TaxID=1777144 RepID=UPI001FCA0E49|nr:helix-turn-helix transcriptional regulator [Caballeronia ptereochthonis]